MKIFHYYLITILSLGLNTSFTQTDDIDDFQKSQLMVVDSQINSLLNNGLGQLKRLKHTLEYMSSIVLSGGTKFKNKDSVIGYVKTTLRTINSML